jgi:hypothetical protein
LSDFGGINQSRKTLSRKSRRAEIKEVNVMTMPWLKLRDFHEVSRAAGPKGFDHEQAARRRHLASHRSRGA